MRLPVAACLWPPSCDCIGGRNTAHSPIFPQLIPTRIFLRLMPCLLQDFFERAMRHLHSEGFNVIALRDLAKFVAPASPGPAAARPLAMSPTAAASEEQPPLPEVMLPELSPQRFDRTETAAIKAHLDEHGFGARAGSGGGGCTVPAWSQRANHTTRSCIPLKAWVSIQMAQHDVCCAVLLCWAMLCVTL